MEQRPLGKTGVTVSALGFGAGAIGLPEQDERGIERLLSDALDAGVTLFDAARSYGLAEERLGRHLRHRRGEVVLSTKGGYGIDGVADWTGTCIARGIERALQSLQTDHLDIFHLHSCPVEVAGRDDVLSALEAARRAGKIRVAGYAGDNAALAWAAASEHFGAIECSFNVVDQANASAMAVAAERGLGIIAKRPLANAVWRDATEPAAADRREYWRRWRERGLTTGDAAEALRFAVHGAGVSSAIVGCSHGGHLRDNLHALEGGPLSAERIRRFHATGAGWPAVT